jgi:hypothetical protein
MADYDSDSSGTDDVETNVLLGYASREPTSDDFSQIGGHPVRVETTCSVRMRCSSPTRRGSTAQSLRMALLENAKSAAAY